MISTSSAFQTANAELAKKPIFLIDIKGYWRPFANVRGLSYLSVIQSGSKVWDFGGAEAFDATVTLSEPVTAGHPIFVFMYDGSGHAVTSITDTGSHTWNLIYVSPAGTSPIYAWYAIANADYPSGLTVSLNGGSIHGGNFEIYAVEVPANPGFSAVGASGVGSPATITAGSSTISFTVDAASPWHAVFVELAPAYGTSPAFTMLFVDAYRTRMPALPGNFIAGGAASSVYGTSGPVYDWITNIDDLKLTISDLDGGSDLGDLVFTVQDHQPLITADLATFVFEGKRCKLLAGFVGMAIADYVTLFTGAVDRVESENGNTEYKFTVSDINLKKLTQVIYTTGDDGFATDSKHPKTINAHPLDVLVDALEQAGVPAGDIDTAKIEYYRDGIFNGLSFEFTLTSAPAAKDFIESELMKPLGMYLWANNLGVVSINSFYPAISGSGSYTPPTPPVMTLDNDTVIDVPLEQEAELIDQVTLRFDWDETGEQKFLAESVQNWNPGILKYGLYGSQIIESKGLRSGFQGFFMAMLVARLIFLRYGNKQLVLDPLSLIWTACVLEPGDIIALTNPFLPDRVAGALGVTDMTFEVLDRNWQFMNGLVELRLLRLDISQFKEYRITPNGEAAFASASPTDQGKYMFQSDATGKYSTGADGNTLG